MNNKNTTILPGAKKFNNLFMENKVVPVCKKINSDMFTPVSLFHILAEEKDCYLLESAESSGRWNQYSVIGLKQHSILKVENGKTISVDNKLDIIKNKTPFDTIEDVLKKYKCSKFDYVPKYFSGITGYIGYDMIQYCEKITFNGKDDLKLPEAYLMIPEEVIVFDHYSHNLYIIINCFFDRYNEKTYDAAVNKIADIENKIYHSNTGFIPEKENSDDIKPESNISKEQFCENVKIAKNHIYEGDIFQVVLSQRLKAKCEKSDFDVYRRLRKINPSPYMYLLRLDGFSIVGASPEMLVKVDNGIVETNPIAGTRKRGQTEEQDVYLENDLLSDKKELAEHSMLVDLGRNDVGKVSEFGTVKVTDPMHIERFSHVMHIVSNVFGALKAGLTQLDALKAILPAGTVSGAPKIRAMEIIDKLENLKRGVYAGAVGSMGFDGSMDTCITIRTAVIKDNYIYVQAGAGIVADSVPENEYIETINKAKAIISAI